MNRLVIMNGHDLGCAGSVLWGEMALEEIFEVVGCENHIGDNGSFAGEVEGVCRDGAAVQAAQLGVDSSVREGFIGAHEHNLVVAEELVNLIRVS